MKQIYPALLMTGLAATWIGCETASEPGAPTANGSADSAEVTLVTLSVPAMV